MIRVEIALEEPHDALHRLNEALETIIHEGTDRGGVALSISVAEIAQPEPKEPSKT